MKRRILSIDMVQIQKILEKCIILAFILILNKNTHSQELSLLFDHITVEQGLSHNTVTSITKDKYGFIWIATFNGLNRYDGCSIKIYKTNNKDSASISNNRIEMLTIDQEGVLWVQAFDDVFNRYNYDLDNFTRIPVKKMSPGKLDSLQKANQNLGSSYKNWRFELTGKKFRYTNTETGEQVVFSHDPLDHFSIGDDYVNFAYVDDQHILWLGTNNGGAQKVDLERHPFYHYKQQLNTKNSLINNNIRAILEDKNGIVWIGTRDDGITKYDRKNNIYTHIQHQKGNPNSLPDNRIRKIYEDKFGNIWIGSISGLFRYDAATGNFHKYVTNTYQPDNEDRTNCLMEDNEGNLWAGTAFGICRLDRNTNTFITYDVGTKTQLKGRVRALIKDKQNIFWLACDGGGLIKFVPNPNGSGPEDAFIPTYFLDGNDEKTISNNRVYTLCEDENGDIWIGTAGGLNKMDRKTETFIHFTEENGLPDNMIVGMLYDGKEHLWLSHSRGISKFNIYNYSIKNYSIQDGLQGIDFNEDAYYKSKKGEMFFGGTNGFNSFYPDSIKNNPYLPSMVITGIKLQNKTVPVNKEFNNRIVLKKSIIVTKEIKLKYQDRSIQIEFAALHYSNPKANSYEYILEGFDPEWITTDSDHRIASYSNLPPNTYYFKVKGSNSDGEWNPKPAVLKIVVLPPWWRTLLFRISLALIIIISAISAYIIRISSLKNQKQVLEEKVKQRTLELKNANTVLEKQKDEIIQQKQEIEKSYSNIELIREFGQKLTSTLNLESINSMIFDYVKSLMSVTNFGIGIYNLENSSIDFPALMENGSPIDGFSSSLSDTTSCAAWSFNNNRVIFCENFTKEYSKYISKINIRTSQTPESLIYIPLFVENKKIGILTVQSVKQNAYSENDFTMLQMLASYIAIALDNANVYEELERSNKELKIQTEIVRETNSLLLERQQKIEEQSEELIVQTEKLSQTNQSLKMLNATKDKLFSIIAHDLKNPFSTILGFSEMLVKKFDVYTPEQKHKFLNLIHKSAQNVFDLLQNLLQWARTQTGNIQCQPQNYNLKVLIDDNTNLIADMLREKELTLTVDIPEKIIIYADINMINTVVRNLLTNAVKFTESGNIDISAIEIKDYITVNIKDTGIGIPKNKIDELFKIGNSSSTAGTRGESGTGLGLVICKEFLEKNNGSIRVTSETGIGSTFSFVLPKGK
ncbi:MAG: GAF domain-containing protein [Bacteroidales bacterium]|nr:GAF domain-containing protein [Bacteroidales bacterium]